MDAIWLQYGALGLLGMILFFGGRWAGKLLERVAERMAAAFDKQAEALDKLLEKMNSHELEDEKRHHAEIVHISDQAKMIRHTVANILQTSAAQKMIDDEDKKASKG
jgi:hypothetical protein